MSHEEYFKLVQRQAMVSNSMRAKVDIPNRSMQKLDRIGKSVVCERKVG
jgi:hypothetical protein